MAIVNGYCTVAELAESMGLDSDEQTAENDRLEAAIEQASRYIDERTKKKWYSVTLTAESCDRYGKSDNGIRVGNDAIIFPMPIIEITSIVEDDETLTVNDDYYVYKSDAKVVKDGYWTTDHKGIAITGSMGYAATPEHIKRFCIVIAKVFSGISTRMVTDENADISTVFDSYVPTWIQKALSAEAINRV